MRRIKNTKTLNVGDYLKITRNDKEMYFYYKVTEIIDLYEFDCHGISHWHEGYLRLDYLTDFNTYIMSEEEVTEYLLNNK